jgi:uncharacterized protein (TIGR00106 family)
MRVVLDHGPVSIEAPNVRVQSSWSGMFRPTMAVSGSACFGGVLMIIAFSITPLGVGEDVATAVAEAVRVVRSSGLPNRTDAMFTMVEGDWDEVMDVVKRAMDAVLVVAPRASMVLKADVRPGVVDAMTSKVASLEAILAEPA